jgi:hypothetical protein
MTASNRLTDRHHAALDKAFRKALSPEAAERALRLALLPVCPACECRPVVAHGYCTECNEDIVRADIYRDEIKNS